jgi:hypothetical protein
MWEMEILFLAFLTSVLENVCGQLDTPAALSVNRLRLGGWVGLRSGRCRDEKILLSQLLGLPASTK